VLALKEQTRSEDTRTGVERIVPTEIALEEARRRGLATTPMSRSTVDRYKRRRKLSQRQRIWRPKRAERPNDMHQIDASGSKMLRVAEARADGNHLIGVRPRTGYTRKRSEEPLGVWLVGVVDDMSGATHLEYCVGPGESADMVLDAVRAPWGGDPRCAIRGLPLELNCDFGPFRSSGRMQNLLDGLGVRLTDRMPDSPNVSGKMERRWRTVWERFETTFRWTPERVLALSDLNRELGVHTAQDNARACTWAAGRRIDVYQAGLAQIDVRLMPEDLGQALYSEGVRKVTASASVQWRNVVYGVDDELVGEWVEVMQSAGGEVIVRRPETGEVFDATEVEPTAWDVFEPRHHTPQQWLEKEAAEIPAAETAHYGDGRGVLHLTPAARAAEPDTPFTRRERARRFVNVDEGVERAILLIGGEVLMREPGLIEEVKALIEKLDLDRERCDEAFFALRDRAG